MYYLFFTFVNNFLSCGSDIFPVTNREINVVWDMVIAPFYLSKYFFLYLLYLITVPTAIFSKVTRTGE